jgi:energy-coupling factor transporter ATP-binding protein EcfA2
MCGYGFVSARTAADHTWFRYYFLETMVYMLLAQRYVVPLHAACVARNGSGVLLCGVSGAGKSTLAYACARAGWTYLADDSTLLLPDADDRTAIGRPYLVRLRDDAAKLFPELAGYSPRPRPNGKLSIEVPLSAFPGIQTASRCRIDCVVFLERQRGSATRAQALPPGEVVETLLRDMPSYGDEVRAMVEKAVRRLRQVPAYRMQYDALGDAVELLSELAHTTE